MELLNCGVSLKRGTKRYSYSIITKRLLHFIRNDNLKRLNKSTIKQINSHKLLVQNDNATLFSLLTFLKYSSRYNFCVFLHRIKKVI